MIKQMDVLVWTLSPVVLTDAGDSTVMTETKKTIPGTVLRGVLAGRYIKQTKAGKEAHRDARFCRFFFGGLRFVDAHPVCHGERAFFLPFSLQKEKAKEEQKTEEIQDLLKTKTVKDGFKSFRGLAVLQQGLLYPATVKTSISLHITRSDAGRRLLGSSQDGGIYNYESLCAGQCFCGSILGEEDLLLELLQALEVEDHVLDCRLGRSRYTQYGSCRMEFQALRDPILPAASAVKDHTVLLRLDTTYLPVPGGAQQDAWSGVPTAKDMLAEIPQRLGTDRFEIEAVYASFAEVENFVGHWKMKQPRRYGLAAGSVFSLRCKDGAWTEEDRKKLGKMLYDGVGLRTAEGFGQLRIWEWCEYRLGGEKERKTMPCPMLPQIVRDTVQRILQTRILDAVRLKAAEDVRGMHVRGTSAHFFARLSEILHSVRDAHDADGKSCIADQLRQTLNRMVKPEQRTGAVRDKEDKAATSLKKMLELVVLCGRPLADYLLGKEPPPYAVHEAWRDALGCSDADFRKLQEEVGMELLAQDLTDGCYFYAYWHWLFHHARKAAVQARRDA